MSQDYPAHIRFAMCRDEIAKLQRENELLKVSVADLKTKELALLETLCDVYEIMSSFNPLAGVIAAFAGKGKFPSHLYPKRED